MKKTVLTFAQAKKEGRKLSMLTAYDFTTAKLVDEAGVDSILVGDSLGNVILGYESTTRVAMDDMIHHGAAVCRGVKEALVVIDMPFMSYQVSVEEAVRNAGRLIAQTGAAAVKLEGGIAVAPQIRAIVDAGIPVCAHVGLTPQSANALGGHRVQGKSLEAASRLLADARAVQEAGAFAVVLECVPAPLATLVTEELSIPTIGIGAGAGCDGQVLVYADLLGMFDGFRPKFVKRYAEVGQVMAQAFAAYDAEVKAGAFPDPEREFSLDPEVLHQLREREANK